MIPAKTAEPIEMPFEFGLGLAQGIPSEGAIREGEGTAHSKV